MLKAKASGYGVPREQFSLSEQRPEAGISLAKLCHSAPRSANGTKDRRKEISDAVRNDNSRSGERRGHAGGDAVLRQCGPDI
jgi:hypothetical protein